MLKSLKMILIWVTTILAIVFAWLFYPTFQFWMTTLPTVDAIDPMLLKEVKVIAHRGASGHAPENTLIAVQRALEMGADMIEIDVHLTKEGEVVVLHDHTLDRTTNGKGNVYDHTLEQIKALDAGSWYNSYYEGEAVPTLGEVLALIDGKAICLIEIKWGNDFIYEGIVSKIHNIIMAYDAKKWAIIQSFETEYLQQSAALDHEISIHQLVVAKRKLPLPFQYDRKFKIGAIDLLPQVSSINPFYITLSKEMVDDWHTKGLTVFTYTVNEQVEMLKLIDMGVDGIITNHPDKLKAILDDID